MVSLYFPTRFLKDLVDDHTEMYEYMGINANSVNSKDKTKFKIDFMSDEIIYNKKNGFECDDSHLCTRLETGFV